MLLEEVTQEELDHLVACAHQRSLFAACIAGMMQVDVTSKEALSMKNTIMQTVSMGLDMGLRVRDEIEKCVLITMKNHCEEQIEINELLSTI